MTIEQENESLKKQAEDCLRTLLLIGIYWYLWYFLLETLLLICILVGIAKNLNNPRYYTGNITKLI